MILIAKRQIIPQQIIMGPWAQINIYYAKFRRCVVAFLRKMELKQLGLFTLLYNFFFKSTRHISSTAAAMPAEFQNTKI